MENQTCCCEKKNEATSKLVFEQGDLYYCGDPNCKKAIEKEMQEDHERTLYQGRTFQQYKSSADILHYTALIFLGFVIGLLIYSFITSF